VIPGLSGLEARLRTARGVLVDSNILLDIATSDPKWGLWSEGAIAACAEHVSLIINPIIYAEVSIGYTTVEALNTALSIKIYEREALPWEAAFLAGKCFLTYRRRGGKTSPISDFYIGAHAAVGRLALLTRDAARYRTYFPNLEILSPPTDPLS
jgi:predicted nucleic acid-binding protein